MASPAKRRKKNDQLSSPPSARAKRNSQRAPPTEVRSLEYFFGKQSKEAQLRTLREGPYPDDRDVSNPKASTTGRTDEQMARWLQEQFDKEQEQRISDPSADVAIESNETHKDHLGDTPGQPQSRPDNAQEQAPSSSLGRTNGELGQHDQSHLSSVYKDQVAKNAKTLSLQSNAASEDTLSSTVPFDESPLTFTPSKYIDELRQHWQSEGGDASYALLTRCFVLVNSTQSRIKIVDNLVNFLRLIIEADAESLLPAVWLATNAISPPYISLELGLGGSALSKALKKVCGLDGQGLKTLYNKHGDAGDVAFEAKKRQSFTLRKPKPLTIKAVYQSLVKIANSRGNGSQEIKQRIVERLVQDARGAEESRYIVRTLVQHVRAPVSIFCLK